MDDGLGDLDGLSDLDELSQLVRGLTADHALFLQPMEAASMRSILVSLSNHVCSDQ